MKSQMRIAWIDSCKGFAMFLVVLAHIIAWMFKDWNIIMASTPTPSWLWRCIYFFHMPLLMFLSGFLCARRSVGNLSELLRLMGKLAMGLLVPDFVMSIVRYLVCGGVFSAGAWPTFWYLEVLYILCIVYGIVDLALKKIDNAFVKSCMITACFGLTWAVAQSAYAIFGGYYFSKTSWMLPFFLGGVIAWRGQLFEQLLTSKVRTATLFAIAGILFVVSIKVDRSVTPWVGTFATICFFNLLSSDGFVVKCLSLVGRASIQIYILHAFARCVMPMLGEALHFEEKSVHLSSLGVVGQLHCFGYQFAVSAILSVCIICGCIFLASAMSYSRILSKVCFGRVLFVKGGAK